MTKKNMQSVCVDGTKLLKIPTTVVFAALQDRKRLEKLVPGCRYIDKTEYKKSTSEVLVNLDNKECLFLNKHWTTYVEPSSKISVSVTGNGGPAGRFTANLDIIIKSEENTTGFYYSVNANFYWKSVVFSKESIESSITQVIEMFLNNLQQQYFRETDDPFNLFLTIKKLIN